MPRGDGTGPHGQGLGKGKGQGGGGGYGRSNRSGKGPKGFYVCSVCGFQLARKTGVRCFQMKCPKCGAMMSRERVAGSNVQN
jgi:rubrerythrin